MNDKTNKTAIAGEVRWNRRPATTNHGSRENFRTILVPLDFTPSSVEAIRLAGRLADRFGSRVHLLHVEDPGTFMNDVEHSVVIAKSRDEVTSQDLHRLKRLAQRELSSSVPSTPLVRWGRPAHEILNAAADLHSDLIVLATHRHSSLSRLLRGSTAETVMHRARCPVLLVPSEQATKVECELEQDKSTPMLEPNLAH